MLRRLTTCAFLLLVCASFSLAISPEVIADDAKAEGPLKILLITSGCCHDYDFQTRSMQLALKDRGVEAQWDVVNEGGKGTDAEIEFYKKPNWADGYDVVIHNECFAKTDNPDYIRGITKPHHDGRMPW